MLRDLEVCFREDLIFLGLFPEPSTVLTFLEVFGLEFSDLLDALLGLDRLDWLGLDFLEWLGLGSPREFCLESFSCFWGDLFGDRLFVGWISACTVLIFVGGLPSSSVCIGWKVSGACDDWISLAWLPVLPADNVDVVLQGNR